MNIKLIDLTCPHCNAQLKVGSNKTWITCEYCGSTLMLQGNKENTENGINHEAAGYQFEKGRQRAMYEAARQREQFAPPRQFNVQNNQQGIQLPPNHPVNKNGSNTALWVLGWIFIFPLPVTLLLLRKKDLDPKIKYAVIAAVWVVYIIIAMNR